MKSDSSINELYDIAIVYADSIDFITYFVLNKIKSRKKFKWINFYITKIRFKKKFAEKNYKEFSKIFVVSEEEKLINLIYALNNNV